LQERVGSDAISVSMKSSSRQSANFSSLSSTTNGNETTQSTPVILICETP